MAAERIAGVDTGELYQALGEVKDQVVGAVQEARERVELDRRIRETPWLVLGVAAGAGFLLGGGLWPALRPLFKAAGRTALTPTNVVALLAALGAARAARGEQAPAEPEASGGPEEPAVH